MYCKEYFDEKIKKTESGGIVYLNLFDKTKKHIFVFENEVWREAEPEERLEINQTLTTRKPFPKIIGFIGEKSNQPGKKYDVVFKTKNTTQPRNTGADCYGATKKDQLVILNQIVEEGEEEKKEPFNNENTKVIRGGICCYIEFTLRYYNTIHPDKIWFLDPDLAKEYGI
jgi:hypothetical protein